MTTVRQAPKPQRGQAHVPAAVKLVKSKRSKPLPRGKRDAFGRKAK
jgi:hypothetical protein